MNCLKKIAALCLLALCGLMLMACGGSKASDNGTVQDIQPGDPSIIQAPAATPERGSTLEERAL